MTPIRLVSTALVATLLFLGRAVRAAEDSPTPAVDAIFADLTKPGSPGCALGIYRDGKIIYAKGYGLANVEENVPITAQTVFDVGSVSKQFTAASILLLERQGKLRLDDDVHKYIPELPDYTAHGGQKITILQLLNHTSGVRDYPTLFLLAGMNPDNVTTDDDALGFIVRQKGLTFPPGTDWQYSNSGYFLLSVIVKRVSGKTLKDFAEENIFRPLGMMHTQFRNDHTALIPHRALAYDPSRDGGYKLSVSYAEETGDGMLQTSIEDLQKWDENFYSEQVGGKGFTAELEEPGRLNDETVLSHAKGLFIGNYRGLRTVKYSGGSGGYRAYLLRFPGQHFSVACLCNLGGVNRAKRAEAIADLYLAEALQRKPETLVTTLTADQLHSMVGIYRDPKRGDVWRFSERDGKLWVDLDGALLELRAVNATEFEPVPYSMVATFKFQAAHRNAECKWIIDTGDQLPTTVEPIQETKPSTSSLLDYPGDYWSDDLKVTYRLTIKGGKLWMSDLIGADGITRPGNVPFSEFRPLLPDTFDLTGAPIVIDFRRDQTGKFNDFRLNGFHERAISFVRRSAAASEKPSVPSEAGPRIRPLTDRKFEKTPERLARGRYLVNGIGECFACHGPSNAGRPGWPPVRGKEGSGDAIYTSAGELRYVAANLTPDRETGAGNWTDDMLARAIREGVGHDGRLLDPTHMPYEFYRAMSDEDLAAIIVYLRSLPAIRNPLPAPKRSDHIVAPFALPITTPVPMPDISTPVKRGAYLVQIGTCQWCHTLRDQSNRQSLPGLEFAGGDLIEPNPYGRATSANITPDPSGISYYNEAFFLKVIHSGKVGARKLNPVMPWWFFGHMSDEDLKAIFVYLRTVKPVHHRVDNTEPIAYCRICKHMHHGGALN